MKRGEALTRLSLTALALCCMAVLLVLSHDEEGAAPRPAASHLSANIGTASVPSPEAEDATSAIALAEKTSSSSVLDAVPRRSLGGQRAASAHKAVSLPLPSHRLDEPPVRPLWKVDLSGDTHPGFPREGLVDVAHPLTLDSNRLTSLSVGDRTTLVIPELGEFEALVERMSMAPNGDVTWMGHLTEVDGSYSVIFTRGEEVTLATIATPGGTYLLEGRGEDAWIFRDDLDELIDPTQTDELIPEAQL